MVTEVLTDLGEVKDHKAMFDPDVEILRLPDETEEDKEEGI